MGTRINRTIENNKFLLTAIFLIIFYVSSLIISKMILSNQREIISEISSLKGGHLLNSGSDLDDINKSIVDLESILQEIKKDLR